MRIIKNSRRTDWSKLTQRPVTYDASLPAKVQGILAQVKDGGDAALRELTRRFDGAVPDSFRVSVAQRDACAEAVTHDLRQAIVAAQTFIERFHRSQNQVELPVVTANGVTCFRRSVPIERVGIYIPAGTAPLFSTLLMLGVPAKVAGCREIVLSTPGGRDATLNPAIAFCAQLLGIEEVYVVGGAQAVAALAYGTESIKPVSKICGPGNRFVTEAKLQVAAQGMAIDMPAGPSEVLVIADDGANPRFIAADLLAQAEHGADSQVVLVACSHALVERVVEQVTLQAAQLPRQDFVFKALENSFALVVDSIDEALEFSNLYAPEHLILSVQESERLIEKVINAGSVFLGYWAAEALGDYASGTNHVLPTNAAARAYSGVSVDTFVKKITFQSVSRGGLLELSDTVATLARAEGLEAHAQAVVVRREAQVNGGQ
jgi:histidinol dehydrogenase